MLINPHKIINFIFLVPVMIIVYKRYRDNNILKTNQKAKDINKEKIINEIEILNKNREAQELEVTEKEIKLEKEIENEKRELIEKYSRMLDIGYIEKKLNFTYESLLKEIERKENRINTIKFELKTIEDRAENVNNKLDDLAKIEEELEDAETEREELLSLNNSYNIAKECLERAYIKVKENISPRFIENLCDIISKISNNRYNNIVLNDAEGLNVEIQNGSYVPVSRLSTGTIDQMYISIRLSALNEISDETMPIILDEAFAYFDDKRLENILKYLHTNFKENQIIIFTCSKREKKILEQMSNRGRLLWDIFVHIGTYVNSDL